MHYACAILWQNAYGMQHAYRRMSSVDAMQLGADSRHFRHTIAFSTLKPKNYKSAFYEYS
jgi:hypothetical protein